MATDAPFQTFPHNRSGVEFILRFYVEGCLGGSMHQLQAVDGFSDFLFTTTMNVKKLPYQNSEATIS